MKTGYFLFKSACLAAFLSSSLIACSPSKILKKASNLCEAVEDKFNGNDDAGAEQACENLKDKIDGAGGYIDDAIEFCEDNLGEFRELFGSANGGTTIPGPSLSDTCDACGQVPLICLGYGVDLGDNADELMGGCCAVVE